MVWPFVLAEEPQKEKRSVLVHGLKAQCILHGSHGSRSHVREAAGHTVCKTKKSRKNVAAQLLSLESGTPAQ